jgi:hypothetical protein
LKVSGENSKKWSKPHLFKDAIKQLLKTQENPFLCAFIVKAALYYHWCILSAGPCDHISNVPFTKDNL